MSEAKKEIRITVRCSREPSKHAKVLRIDHRLGSRYAQDLAGLLDGSSPAYIYPPGEGSPIGKCGVCGAKISAEVSEVEVTEKNAKP